MVNPGMKGAMMPKDEPRELQEGDNKCSTCTGLTVWNVVRASKGLPPKCYGVTKNNLKISPQIIKTLHNNSISEKKAENNPRQRYIIGESAWTGFMQRSGAPPISTDKYLGSITVDSHTKTKNPPENSAQSKLNEVHSKLKGNGMSINLSSSREARVDPRSSGSSPDDSFTSTSSNDDNNDDIRLDKDLKARRDAIRHEMSGYDKILLKKELTP